MFQYDILIMPRIVLVIQICCWCKPDQNAANALSFYHNDIHHCRPKPSNKTEAAEYKKAFALCGYVIRKGLVSSAVQTGVV
jgi:hypothetical protein